MSNIRFLPTADISLDVIFENAEKEIAGEAIVLGRDKNGNLYFSSSSADCAKNLWMLRLAEEVLIQQAKDL